MHSDLSASAQGLVEGLVEFSGRHFIWENTSKGITHNSLRFGRKNKPRKMALVRTVIKIYTFKTPWIKNGKESTDI